MSLSTLKPVACGIPPSIGANSKVSRVTMTNRQALPPLQVREKEKPLLQETTSRREMMQLTAASIGLLSLLLPQYAEARPRNATMRQKIMEKFEELWQKAGLSKPKDESKEKKPKDEGEEKAKLKVKNEEMKPKLKNGGEENHSTPNGKISVPALPNIINGKTVEITLP